MDALTAALDRANAVVNTAHSTALTLKQAGMISNQISPGVTGDYGMFSNTQSGDSYRYSLFRGWLYSAVNALSCEAAGQPVNVGRLISSESMEPDERRQIASTKSYYFNRMTQYSRSKSIDHGIEVIKNTPLSMALEKPNSIQHRWQFVYTFVANLNITGWAYIVADVDSEGRPEFYSLPTTWITPIHEKGKSFAKFRIKNPKSVGEGKILARENVAFAYLPNPSDPLLSALAPSASQILAIRVDDHIQTSQERFFENGVFPSVIVTVGKDPHPDVPGGIRPRLTGVQRRQVTGAIRKTMSGVSNYGNPAIVDGLIEKIERLSATQTEMGWEKSEDAVMDRILSAFSVPPFILGKALPGSYSQAYVTREIFCRRVNTFLDMLSTVMTNFVNLRMPEHDDVLIWWEGCEPKDPSITSKEIIEARKQKDITQDEFRAHLGLPPAEKEEKRSKFFDSPASLRSVHELLSKITLGEITAETGASVLSYFFEIPIEEARNVIGDGGEVRIMEESVRLLESAVSQLKEPIIVNLEHSDIDKAIKEVSRGSEASNRQIDVMNKTVEDLRKELESLSVKLEIEKTKRECDTKLIAKATEESSIKSTHSIKEAISAIQTIVFSKEDSDSQKQRIDNILNNLSDELKTSFGIIQKKIEQPINIEVTNEVNPTPIEVINKVDVPSVQVDVKNQVETPEVNVEVLPATVKVEPEIKIDVESPTVNVEAPKVSVEPKIQVDVPEIKIPAAEVDVKISREDEPNRATITHPDGRVSQVELKK